MIQKIHSAFTAYHMFEQLIPSAVHSYRSHVCRAFNNWVNNKERSIEVKNLGERFVIMFVHVDNHIISMESIRDEMCENPELSFTVL